MASKKKRTISEQIREALINQKALAKLLDVSDATFTRKMQANEFTREEIKIIECALRIDIYDY